MEDLKSSKSSSIYNEESINELIQNLSEHLKFKSTSTISSKYNHSSTNNLTSSLANQDKLHSPYYSPNNSLSSTASDLINQQSVGMETYFLMQHLLKNGLFYLFFNYEIFQF